MYFLIQRFCIVLSVIGTLQTKRIDIDLQINQVGYTNLFEITFCLIGMVACVFP